MLGSRVIESRLCNKKKIAMTTKLVCSISPTQFANEINFNQQSLHEQVSLLFHNAQSLAI